MSEWETELPHLLRATNFTDHVLTGSANINGEGQDFDVVVLLHDIYDKGMQESLEIDGWLKLGASESYGWDSEFISYRKKNLNIITCSSREYFEKWRTAKEVCLYLREQFGLTTKEVRIATHRIIVDGLYVSV